MSYRGYVTGWKYHFVTVQWLFRIQGVVGV